MASDPSLSQIKQDILRIMNQRDESLANLPIPLSATSDGSTTTIVDTKLIRGSGTSNRFDARQGEWLEDGGTNGPGIGTHFAVDDAGYASSTGTLTVSPTMAAASDSGDDYLLYALGLSPEYVEEHVNQVLRQTRGPHIYFPSMFTDSDFTNASLISWPDTTTPTSTATEQDTTGANNLLGQRSIHFVAGDADEGFRSLDVEVTEGDSMVFACFVRVDSGTIDVQIYDQTNGADIRTVTVDEQAWTLVSHTFTVPDDCEQVRLRVTSNASGDEVYLGAHVILQSLTGTHYTLPNWWDSTTQVDGWGYMPVGTASEDAYSYSALSQYFEEHETPQVIEDGLALTPMRLILQPKKDLPVFVRIQREFSEITMGATASNATTTPIDREFIVYRTVANMMRDMGDETFRGWNRLANERARLKKYHRRGVWIDPNPRVAV